MRISLLISLALFGAPAALSATRLCPGQEVAPLPDGRMLGHLPYEQVQPEQLVRAPAGFAIGGECLLRREVVADLERLLAAARAAGLGGAVRAVSCYRSVARQGAVFCGQIGPRKRARDAADRARSVGPPGYSEHATGYALDFGTRPSPRCHDVSPCFAQTPAGRWLIAHAPDYGFELSFPAGNAQGVSYEPWHWRWVGGSLAVPGAAAARTTFTRARASFPALPAVSDNPARALSPTPGFNMLR
ncbi:MAG: M15 family metallopeptidase [Sphingomonas sp.]|nr:M15 family metallopeptidase [Sphingomonas sp.]